MRKQLRSKDAIMRRPYPCAFVSLLACMVIGSAYAQPRPIVSVQEAQTPPRIDPEQLRAASAALETNTPAVSPDLAELQNLANATAPRTAQGRKQQAQAMWQLGLLKLHGLHAPLDPAQANTMFERAYALGHPLAAAGLAWCALDGCGQRPQPLKAQQWLQTLRQQAPGRAAYMEWLFLEGAAPMDADMTSTSPQTDNAMQRRKQQALQRAVKANDPHARVEWGLELAAEGRTREALEQFRAASAKSEAARRNVQVLSAQSSQRVRPSGNLGQAGGAWQTFRQARIYHRGEGVPANYTEAIRLYKRASDMGNVQAKRMLALIYSRPQADGNLDIGWMQQLAYADVSENSNTPIHSPSAPASLQRDPTPLYDYIDARWRK